MTRSSTLEPEPSDDIGRNIPAGSKVVRRTPTWTRHTVPAALLANHQSTVWAELVVVRGSVHFIEPESGYDCVATPNQAAVIVPGREHRIEPSEAAEFAVHFYKNLADRDG